MERSNRKFQKAERALIQVITVLQDKYDSPESLMLFAYFGYASEKANECLWKYV